MKIGMLLDTGFPPDSRVENEAVSLINAGHQVFLFSLDFTGSLPKQEIVNGINVRRYYASGLTYKMSALAYTLPIYRRIVTPLIVDFIGSINPDVLHIHDMVLGKAGMKAARKFDLPVILDLHENRPVIMKEYVHLKRFPGNIIINPGRWEKAQRKLVKEAEKIIVVTEEAKGQLVKDYYKDPADVVVVPNTIHTDLYLSYEIDPGVLPSSHDFTLLYMGDTGLRRGTDTAIRALSILRNSGQDVRLVLVGSNTEDIHLRQLTNDLGMEDHVIFKGWQDVSWFPSYVALSDICLSPLKRNLHHDTTYANKIFQYMAIGKPVLVSNCPAQERVIRDAHAGLVHKADNPADLAAKALTLIENSSLRKKMGDNARKAVMNKWNWEQTSQSLISMYKSFSENLHSHDQ